MFWGKSSSSDNQPTEVATTVIPPANNDLPSLPTPPASPAGSFSAPPFPIDYTKPITPVSGDGIPGSGLVKINAAEFFEKYGHPGPVSDQAIRDEYISFFDRRTRNPYYVVEHITEESLKYVSNPPVDRKNSVFREDPAIPDTFKSKLRDYFRSGFDRGHLAPAADAKFSQRAMDQTFFLSNMSPQVGEGFNRDYWSHFEYFCRNLTKDYKSVRVITGPLFLPQRGPDGISRVTYQVIGDPPGVAVPTHFYKIIVGEQHIKSGGRPDSPVAVGAFVLPNSKIDNSAPLKSFAVPVSAIERATGLEFFTKLPQRNRKELCQQVTCEIIVRDFNNAVKSLPPPKK